MTIFILIFLILLVLYGALFEYYHRAWKSLPETVSNGGEDIWINIFPAYPKRTARKITAPVMVSVIIAVRNEERNIKNIFEKLSGQYYNKEHFEVVIIDDHSTDRTWQLMHELSTENLKVVLLQLTGNASGKKRAIEAGITAASGQLIITTDADCTWHPAWIRIIAECYRNYGATFIVAPVMMRAARSFMGIFQALDFLTLQGITAASVHKQYHVMCNGANLAYEKEVFLEVNGFDGIDDIPSGDDMLLMQKICKRYPDDVYYLKSKSAIVETEPEQSWSAFLHQRIRWASKSVHYTDKKIFYILLLTYLVNFSFLILGFASIFHISWLNLFALFLLLKILIEFPFVHAVAGFYGQQSLMKYFPFLQPFHILYIVVAGWFGRFGSYQWKSRTIKNKGKIKPAKQ